MKAMTEVLRLSLLILTTYMVHVHVVIPSYSGQKAPAMDRLKAFMCNKTANQSKWPFRPLRLEVRGSPLQGTTS